VSSSPAEDRAFRGDKILSKDTYWKVVEQKDRL